MGVQLKYCVVGLALTLISGNALADQPMHFEGHAFGAGSYKETQVTVRLQRYDKKVAEAAAKLAAAKIGSIRGSISHDQSPFMVTIEEKPVEKLNLSNLPRLSGSPHPDGETLPPPMVSNERGGTDPILTGSLTEKPTRPTYPDGLYWDKFDSKGRPIKKIF